MKILFDKPALSYFSQVKRLEKKGLIIENEKVAEAFLTRVNYYRLRGYHIPVYNQSLDCFQSGITFTRLKEIYKSDTELRSLTFRKILEIELAMRTHIAYTLAHTYGGLGYTDSNNFYNSSFHAVFVEDYSREIKRSKDIHIKHFREKYGGNVPIWSLVEILTMSCLSQLLKNMLAIDLRSIAKEYYASNNLQALRTNFHSLTVVRNICAHGGRIYGRLLSIKPLLANEYLPYFIKRSPDNFFAVLLVLKSFIVDTENWGEYCNALVSLISEYKDIIDLECLGLPRKWREILDKP